MNSNGMQLSLQQAAGWLTGARVLGDAVTVAQRVHTDTRSLALGDLFVALKGERFDAHDFLPQALGQGAVAALCDEGHAQQLAQSGLPGILVPDTRRALGELAAGWRAQFKLPLIAVTGSNGKTTVTQMVAAILRTFKPEFTLATQGNLNNDIGVPMTLLRLRAQHQLAVVELGMNHPGEIAGLSAMARPTVALVNNAQREHQEFMATVEAVARENGAVLQVLAGSGTAVFPSDDTYSPLWHELAGARATLTFALDNHDGFTDVYCVRPAQWQDGAWAVQAHTPVGTLAWRLRVAGAHNVKNSLAACACALAAGVPLESIAQGLEGFEPVKGRSRALALTVGGQACTLVDDSYNANPDSVRAAVEVLAALPGPRLLVLGDMGEVGQQGPQFHAEIGQLARERGIDQLFTLGELSRATTQHYGGGRHFDGMDELNAAVRAELPRLRSVLVKGSRFMQMERVVQALGEFVNNNHNKAEESHAH
jgi:UDP-N-acetylmuramoyl-tripeptide--D-alanyl-D-alanine ligase